MSGTYSLEDTLLAILIELRVSNQLAAEEFGRDAELEQLRTDEAVGVGYPYDKNAIAEG